MYRRYALLVIAGCLSLGLASARANTQTATIDFTGVSGNYYGVYYTAMYLGTLTPQNGTAMPNTDFVCDDATHEIEVGDTWNANVWDLGNPMTDQNNVAIPGHGAFAGDPYATATYADLKKGHSYSVQEVYSAVGYLANLLFTGASSDFNGIQYAIWALMDDPPAGPSSESSWITTGLAHDSYTNPQIVFYSPDGNMISSGPDSPKGIPQEFIGYTPTAAEPSTVLLLALVLVTGVMLSSSGARWRKKFSSR